MISTAAILAANRARSAATRALMCGYWAGFYRGLQETHANGCRCNNCAQFEVWYALYQAARSRADRLRGVLQRRVAQEVLGDERARRVASALLHNSYPLR